MEQYEDLYIREEKNPAKRRSAWDIISAILLPIVVFCLVVLLCLQFYWLSSVTATSEAPDGIATLESDLPDVTLIDE